MDESNKTQVRIHHALTWAPDETAVSFIMIGEGRIPMAAVKEILEYYASRIDNAINNGSNDDSGTVDDNAGGDTTI